MTNLKDELINTAPREISGSTTFNRYSYQNNWALSLLLSVHNEMDDYAIAIDYFDDVALLDGALAPNSVDFYQVKTKKTNLFKLSDLLRNKKKDGEIVSLSYLGKLYSNYLDFPNDTTSLNFVSNAYYDIDMHKDIPKASTEYYDLYTNQFSESSCDKIRKRLEEEFPDKDSHNLNLFHLNVSALSLQGNTEHTLGLVTEFLSSHLGVNSVNSKGLHLLLADEISKKAKYSSVITDWNTLIKEKCITKSRITALLNEVKVSLSYGDIFKDVLDSISSLYTLTDLIKLRKEARRFEVATLEDFSVHQSKIQKVTNAIQEAPSGLKVFEKIPALTSLVTSKLNEDEEMKSVFESESKEFIAILTIVGLYELIC